MKVLLLSILGFGLSQSVWARSDFCEKVISQIQLLPQRPLIHPVYEALPVQPILPSTDSALVSYDIEANPATKLLLETSRFKVVTAKGQAIPNALHEIGILREDEFRKVGEGSGKEIDIDAFDAFYDHIIVYDKEKKLIVGAYRLARLGDLVNGSSANLYYSSTLFKFHNDYILNRAHQTIELGRATVKKEYQGTEVFSLLWKGIAQYIISSDPNYHRLDGSVSISNSYSDLAKQIMLLYLKKRQNLDLARYLIPNLAPNFPVIDEEVLGPIVDTISNLKQLSEVIEALDGKSSPQLLEHYNSLGAEIINFNQDKDFGNSIDVYISVDLLKMAQPYLKKFLGREWVLRNQARFQP